MTGAADLLLKWRSGVSEEFHGSDNLIENDHRH